MSPKRWKSFGRFASDPFVHGSAIVAAAHAIIQAVIKRFMMLYSLLLAVTDLQGVAPRLKLLSVSFPDKLPGDALRQRHRPRHAIPLKGKIGLHKSLRVGRPRPDEAQRSWAWRHPHAPEERCRRHYARQSALHEHQRMGTPRMAVAPRLTFALAAIRRLKRGFEVLPHILPPEIKTLQEKLPAPELEEIGRASCRERVSLCV